MSLYPYLINSKEKRLPIPIQSDAYEAIKKKLHQVYRKENLFVKL